jgi:hypothetical protein
MRSSTRETPGAAQATRSASWRSANDARGRQGDGAVRGRDMDAPGIDLRAALEGGLDLGLDVARVHVRFEDNAVRHPFDASEVANGAGRRFPLVLPIELAL